MKRLFRSKKVLMMIPGILVAVLVPLGLDPDVADNVVMLVMTYIGGQSAVDVGLAVKGTKTE